MQEQGQDSKKVLSELRQRQTQDKTYRDGRIFGAMCTKPHPTAKKAYMQFFESNLGDSGLFPASAQLEREVVSQLGDLLHCPQAAGFIVSGGTEANFLALAAIKNLAPTTQPQILLPESVHFSFTKICRFLNIKPVYAPLDEAFRVDVKALDGMVNKDTVGVVGTVGTAEFGAVDHIESLSDIAQKHHVSLHVDAAFGGLVVPFLDDPKPRFDFELEAVQSLTVDPHKMGLAAIPAGGILFRSQKQLENLKTETPYLTESCQYTFSGTRSGASTASVWAVLHVLGRGGYRKVVKQCMENTRFLARKLVEAGYCLVVEPTLNVVTFRSQNTKSLAQRLWQMGWYISYNSRYDCIRIVVMPHIKRKNLVSFLSAMDTQKL